MDMSSLKMIFADYLMDLKLPNDYPRYRNYFKHITYSKWAVRELFIFILNNKDKDIIAVTKKFIRIMDRYSKMNRKNRIMFQIAKNTAEDILDIFNAME